MNDPTSDRAVGGRDIQGVARSAGAEPIGTAPDTLAWYAEAAS